MKVISKNQDDGNLVWFKSGTWYLYLSLILSGIAAIPAGLWTEQKVKGEAFDTIVIICLLITGVINIVKGSIGVTAS